MQDRATIARGSAQVMQAVIQRDIPLDYGIWKMVSPECRDLIQAMLTRDPAQRISAEDAMQHAWFRHFGIGALPCPSRKTLKRACITVFIFGRAGLLAHSGRSPIDPLRMRPDKRCVLFDKQTIAYRQTRVSECPQSITCTWRATA